MVESVWYSNTEGWAIHRQFLEFVGLRSSCNFILQTLCMMNPEYPSDQPEHESAFFNNDWITPPLTQPAAFDFPLDSLPERDDLVTSDRPKTKVAIPRITTASAWPSSSRVSRACENCREQKAKCSGHRPACHRCKEADVRCSYGDRKREKMAKWVDSEGRSGSLSNNSSGSSGT
jgi:hypothetical protein